MIGTKENIQTHWNENPCGSRTLDHPKDPLEYFKQIEDRVELEGYFDIPQLKQRLDTGASTVNQAFQLWVVYNLLNWRRSFIADAPYLKV